MADSYIVQGTRSDIQVTGPSTVSNVVVVMATAVPSGVYFEVAIPAESYHQVGDGPFLEATAEGIDWLAAHANVSSLTFSQDLDANGLIADYINAVVTIPTPAGRTGPFSLVVPIGIGVLGADMSIRNAAVGKMIDAAVASLTASATGQAPHAAAPADTGTTAVVTPAPTTEPPPVQPGPTFTPQPPSFRPV